jgi:hypothetical protein
MPPAFIPLDPRTWGSSDDDEPRTSARASGAKAKARHVLIVERILATLQCAEADVADALMAVTDPNYYSDDDAADPTSPTGTLVWRIGANN